VEEELAGEVEFNWRYFPLEQVNSSQGPGWRVWEQDPAGCRGLGALLASAAAKRQGPEVFRRFHIRLLEARHRDGGDLNDETMLQAVAREAGLDEGRWAGDRANPELYHEIAEDYGFAHGELGCFGTPTLVFPEGGGYFVKLADPPADAAAAVELFRWVRSLARFRPLVRELKMPEKQPPGV